jgi:hypothetical protein
MRVPAVEARTATRICHGRPTPPVVIGAELAVDDAGELAFEAAEGFGWGLVLGERAAIVVASGSGVHRLDVGSHAQGAVEGSIAGSGEPVAFDFAAGGFDGCGAGAAGVVPDVGEAGDVAAVPEDLGGQDVADPKDVGKGGPAGGDGMGPAFAVLGQGSGEAAHVRDELAGDGFAFGVDAGRGSAPARNRAPVSALSSLGTPLERRPRGTWWRRSIVRRRSG